MRVCKQRGCDRPGGRVSGLCKKHYNAQYNKAKYKAKEPCRALGCSNPMSPSTGLCHPCKREYEKERRRSTPSIYLALTHHNMVTRVKGRGDKRSRYLYKGLPIVSKDEFIEWALSDPAFKRQYAAWAAAGYERRLAPSIERIDSDKGYIHPNMEWISTSENCRRGALSIHKMR